MPKKRRRLKDRTRGADKTTKFISRAFFEEAGRKGGKVRAKRLSKAKRVTSAKKAARARWVA